DLGDPVEFLVDAGEQRRAVGGAVAVALAENHGDGGRDGGQGDDDEGKGASSAQHGHLPLILLNVKPPPGAAAGGPTRSRGRRWRRGWASGRGSPPSPKRRAVRCRGADCAARREAAC